MFSDEMRAIQNKTLSEICIIVFILGASSFVVITNSTTIHVIFCNYLKFFQLEQLCVCLTWVLNQSQNISS